MFFEVHNLKQKTAPDDERDGVEGEQQSCGISRANVAGSYVNIGGETWFRIENSHAMPEFYTTPVSAEDHWMFASSSGALTAGRKNANHALFPYYSCDKISDTAASTGSLTLIRVTMPDGSVMVWRPFSSPLGLVEGSRNVYKNVTGDRLLLEEVNHTLSLLFRYQWSFGQRFGFVRSCEIVNLSAAPASISILDGILNIVPSGVDKEFQLQYSNLADAYKKSEFLDSVGLGLYYLSSIPTDRAEPSEGLRSTVAWQLGIRNPRVLLSSSQVDTFIRTGRVEQERDLRGRRGAYLVQTELDVGGLDSAKWKIIADVDQDSSDVARLRQRLTNHDDLENEVEADANACQEKLIAIVSAADGRQRGHLRRRTHRHQSNVVYNVMRGGLPANDYEIRIAEFCSYLKKRNKVLHRQHLAWLQSLGQMIAIDELITQIETTGDDDLLRLGREYLPFTFSRRHGDPSRPWNKFSIDIYNPDGSQKLAYQGNWRDIFQNWEVIAFSWPRYTAAMIRRFVNASTADGYNPYRITDDGIEWEKPEEDAFTNIGYWGDHQIIYLSKLLEWLRCSNPEGSNSLLSETGCTYANVPYRIADYRKTLIDPMNTIRFDHDLDRLIDAQVDAMGSDGKLMQRRDGNVFHAAMLEKLILPALVKMTNFVPGGGIWLNTQRPEWNDANNALVGNGMSVVTACYLRRYLQFLTDWFRDVEREQTFFVSSNVAQLALRVGEILDQQRRLIDDGCNGKQRKAIVDALSQVGSDHRNSIYHHGMPENRQAFRIDQCNDLFSNCIAWLDECIRSNRRGDGLFHSYNLLQRREESFEVERLAEMLEGQVAVISSGALSPNEVCEVLDALRSSRLYRADQDSYILYPDRQIASFTEKNVVASDAVDQSELLLTMLRDGVTSIVQRDVEGNVHFNADFRNVNCLRESLDAMKKRGEFSDLIDAENELVAHIYEQTFRHRRFTGRSENFFGYEGLGSIYWHMVSKLALAAMETLVELTRDDSADATIIERLYRHYVAIRDGLGLEKSPDHFGAFPTDPYSHTPAGAGAKQPGMTGQVKEDILCRMLELGGRVDSGRASFDPQFFDSRELLVEAGELDFVSLAGQRTRLPLEPETFGWTWCQVPIVYHRGDQTSLEIKMASGEVVRRELLELSNEETNELFDRSQTIERIDVFFYPTVRDQESIDD